MLYKVSKATNGGFIAGFYNTICINTSFCKSDANWTRSSILLLSYIVELHCLDRNLETLWLCPSGSVS